MAPGKHRVTHAEVIAAETMAGRAELLCGICRQCGEWFPVDQVGEPCPGDITDDRAHEVNYYALCGVRRGGLSVP